MFTLRIMTLDDYDAVITLMKNTPGVSVRDADSRESTSRYLQRNPGMSFVAEMDSTIVGCVMCGHDGRRGYLQHLLVLENYRRQGIANALVERCLSTLESQGILKCHLDVLKTNHAAAHYWSTQGWQLRTDIDRYSFIRSGGINV
ncbi:GNAT family N-acetyltransferase [Pseudomonas viridiflava]|uniref:GNAT family N-acetyltransferase n=1 Tax=Pseudomonas viridiflava TaxID=33069 RepID=UPI000F063037|nr:GNAT family N-acetyltransferase [Pseudomonas viridiflava]